MLTFGNVYIHLYIPHRQFFQVYLWRCFISLAALYLWIDGDGYLKKIRFFVGYLKKKSFFVGYLKEKRGFEVYMVSMEHYSCVQCIVDFFYIFP